MNAEKGRVTNIVFGYDKTIGDSFKISHKRQSNKYLFSTLIKCKECG